MVGYLRVWWNCLWSAPILPEGASCLKILESVQLKSDNLNDGERTSVPIRGRNLSAGGRCALAASSRLVVPPGSAQPKDDHDAFLTRTALTRTALTATVVASLADAGVATAQASTPTLGADAVTVELSATEVSLASTNYRTMCAATIVPPVGGTTPFEFDTDRCVSGLLQCLTDTPGGRGPRTIYSADRVACQPV
jgi:hypothetical protein